MARRWVAATTLMLVWWIVTYGFGSLPLTGLQPAWFPNLGTVVTNLLSLVVVLAVGFGLYRSGWLGEQSFTRIAGWRRVNWRFSAWLLPVVAVQMSYLWVVRDGAPGVGVSAGMAVSIAIGMLAVGLSEETASRGLPLGSISERRSPWPGVALTAVLFGLWHAGNLLFGQSIDETGWQILATTTFGVCFAGMRLLTGSIWPGVALHALGNWTQLVTPGAAPFEYQVAVMVFQLVWGCTVVVIAQRRIHAARDSKMRA